MVEVSRYSPLRHGTDYDSEPLLPFSRSATCLFGSNNISVADNSRHTEVNDSL